MKFSKASNDYLVQFGLFFYLFEHTVERYKYAMTRIHTAAGILDKPKFPWKVSDLLNKGSKIIEAHVSNSSEFDVLSRFTNSISHFNGIRNDLAHSTSSVLHSDLAKLNGRVSLKSGRDPDLSKFTTSQNLEDINHSLMELYSAGVIITTMLALKRHVSVDFLKEINIRLSKVNNNIELT